MTSAAGVELSFMDGTLIDHHCHGVVGGALDRAAFEQLMTESDQPAPAGTTYLTSPLGLAIRRWCAPLLDLEPNAPAEKYLERRAGLGPDQVNRRLLRSCGISHLLLDTGFQAGSILTPAEMAAASGARTSVVVRIEALAEEVAATNVSPREFPGAFEAELRRQATSSVGLKTIIAYRFGLDFDPERPTDRQLGPALEHWLGTPGRSRLAEPVVLRWILWRALDVARESGLPIQFHVGYGDSDLQVHRCNPLQMTSFIRSTVSSGVPLMLLHCYPYEREAGYLAAVYPHVYLDVGCVVHYSGAQSARVIARSMELAPFHKVLFSTDAFGLPELYVVGSILFRRGLDVLLRDWVTAGDCAEKDAHAIASMVSSGNALRIYPGLNTRDES
jgi:predicted TIM-barrel fold metal-dependent hydrolase